MKLVVTETHEDHGLVDNSDGLSPVWPLNYTIEGGTKNSNISHTDPRIAVTIGVGRSCMVSAIGYIYISQATNGDI